MTDYDPDSIEAQVRAFSAQLERTPAQVPLVFVDTETTSLDRDIRRVWDLGMIKRWPDGRREGLSMIIGDVVLAHPDNMSLKIGHFFERHPIVGGTPEPGTVIHSEEQAARIAFNWLAGATWVGAVPDFDESSLYRLLQQYNYPRTWHYHLVDVENLAAGRLQLQPPWNFDAILKLFGLEYDEARRHTAIGDAGMVEMLYDAVMFGPMPEPSR